MGTIGNRQSFADAPIWKEHFCQYKNEPSAEMPRAHGMIGITPKDDGLERKAKAFKKKPFAYSSRGLRSGGLYN
jgi:hypothetical protein